MLHNFILIFDEFDGIKADYPNYTHINKLYWSIERINPYQCGFIHHGIHEEACNKMTFFSSNLGSFLQISMLYKQQS